MRYAVLFLLAILMLAACVRPSTPTAPLVTPSATVPAATATPAATETPSPSPTSSGAIGLGAPAYIFSGTVEEAFDDGFTLQGTRLFFRDYSTLTVKVGDEVNVFVVELNSVLYVDSLELLATPTPTATVEG